jgi:cbb3-type cytochrome oxidase subunit 3
MNRLSDFVGNAGLAIYTEIALVLFFLAFVGICLYLVMRKKESWEHLRNLPLEDDALDVDVPGAAGAEDGR